MGKTIEIEKAELLLGLELAKAALKMDAGFKLEVGEHDFFYSWGHITQSDTWLGTVKMDDLEISGHKRDVEAIVVWLIILSKNPVAAKCSLSKCGYTYTFRSWLQAHHPEEVLGTFEGYVGGAGHSIPQMQLIPTVHLTVEKNDEDAEDSESDRED